MLGAGDTISDYQILAVLGQGGMGAVYRVRNLLSQREEAMKVVLPGADSRALPARDSRAGQLAPPQHRRTAHGGSLRRSGANDPGADRRVERERKVETRSAAV